MKNKTLWTDTEGKPIQAHGGMILQHKGIYYWYGENKDTETVNRHVDFIGISCYSSEELLQYYDGVSVATWVKNGNMKNPIDPKRAEIFMSSVQKAREKKRGRS